MTRRMPLPTRPRILHLECVTCHDWFWVEDLETWRRRGGMCAHCAGIMAEREAERQIERAGVAIRYSESD